MMGLVVSERVEWHINPLPILVTSLQSTSMPREEQNPLHTHMSVII